MKTIEFEPQVVSVGNVVPVEVQPQKSDIDQMHTQIWQFAAIYLGFEFIVATVGIVLLRKMGFRLKRF